MIRRLFSSALKKGKLKKKIIPKDSNSLPKIVDSFENSEATEAEKVDGSMLFPREIVKRLDQHIIAQQDAKKAVAIALRDRWRRSRIDPSVKSEVLPSHILLIGHTGSGKTETARRLAKIVDSPFVKVEATSYTEVGIVGPNVKSMIEDLVEVAHNMIKLKSEEWIKGEARKNAIEIVARKVINDSEAKLRADLLKQIEDGFYDDVTIDISDVQNDTPKSVFVPLLQQEIVLHSHAKFKGMSNLKVKEALKLIEENEFEKLLDKENLKAKAIEYAEQYGIIFVDEIDKIAVQSKSVSVIDRKVEGVQKELLTLFEGSIIQTKFGNVNTSHILFIASGAFHIAKPSDLLPELQGRLPIRVELKPLTESDFRRILLEPKFSLIDQHTRLLATEGVELIFEESAIHKIASICWELNQSIENIGARRLRTVLSKVLEDISFSAEDYKGTQVRIDSEFVSSKVESLLEKTDLSRYIL